MNTLNLRIKDKNDKVISLEDNLQGKVLLQKLDINTMEIIETLPLEENDISSITIMDYILNNNNGRNLAVKRTTDAATTVWNIYWSQSPIKQSNLINSIPIGGTLGGYVNVNVGSPFFTYKPTQYDKNWLTFVADILPDVTERTIRSVGLGVDDASITLGTSYSENSYLNLLTTLNLVSPCIQDTMTVIRITYRIFYNDPANNIVYAEYSDDVNNKGYSEYSDGVYNYFTDMLRYISDGSTTDNVPLLLQPYNRIYASTFYTPSIIDNYKPTTVIGSETYSVTKFHDQALYLDAANTHTTYTNGTKVITISSALNDIASMGTFFRAITVHKLTTLPQLGSPYGIGDSVGNILNNPYLYTNIFNDNVSPIKNVFTQLPTAPGPLLDLLTNGTMTGTLTFDTNTWITQKFPKLVRINITSTGDINTATYQYETATFSGGFIQNSYNPREVIIPQDGWNTKEYTYHRKKVQDNQILDKVSTGGTTIRTPDDNKYFVVTSCLRNRGSISYYNIETGNKYILNNFSSPRLPVGRTSDMAVSNGYTFVTCISTGVWKISPDFTSVTRITDLPLTYALQIDVKDNGDLWVLFPTQLVKGITTDNGVSFNWYFHNTTTNPAFSLAGYLPNADWDNIISMVVDPEHENDRILFIVRGTYNALEGIWWDGLTGTTSMMANFHDSSTTYSGYNNLERSDLPKCSGGYWFFSPRQYNTNQESTPLYITTFGGSFTEKTTYPGVDGRVTPITYNNNKGILVGSSSSEFLSQYTYASTPSILAYDRYPSFFVKNISIPSLPDIFTTNMPQIEFHVRSGAMDTSTTDLREFSGSLCGAYPIVYMKNSNMIINYNPFINVFSFSPLVAPTSAPNYSQFKGAFWRSYGWNGDSWELGNTSSKPCHSTLDTLLDGLKFKFNDGISGTSFVDTESFIFVVGDGIMKDNTSAINFNLGLYPYESENITELYTLSSGRITTVPSEIYGKLVGEPMTFREVGNTEINVITTKNLVSPVRHGEFTMFGCDEIYSNTEFTITFKLMSTVTTDIGGYTVAFTLMDTMLNFRCSVLFSLSSGDLIIIDGNIFTGSVIGTIPASVLTIDKEFKIVRYNSNRICFYYDNILYTSMIDSSKLYPTIYSNLSTPLNVSIFKGFHDLKITYTDYRRMALFGNPTLKTGKHHDKFVCTSVNNAIGNINCTINSIPQTILFNHSSSSVLLANEVRYEHGSGYLVFSDMPTITVTTSGSTTSPALYAIISLGIIISIVIDKNGSGYTSTPTITISPPVSGTTAIATIILDATNSINDLVTITDAGDGYITGIYPLIILGGGGIGASGYVHISASGVVANVEITNGGSQYITVPSLSFTGAGSPSIPAILTAEIGKRINTIIITDGGTGYIDDAGNTVTANTVALYHP